MPLPRIRKRVLTWLSKYWAILLMVFVAIGWVHGCQSDKLMDQRAKYTIGTVTGWNIGRSGIHYTFYFTVADSTYEGASLGIGDHAKTPNGLRFVVKYDSVSPGTNVGYFEYPVPDSLRRVPRRGWLTPPVPMPEWISDRGEKEK